MGANTDGYFMINITGPDHLERCYVYNGLSPTKSIVAACYGLDRVKK